MSVKIGRIRGINIKINYSWVLIFFFITWSLANNYLPSQYPNKPNNFYWTIGLVSTLSLYLSILVHELAHSAIAQGEGLEINNITLHFFGGVSQIREESSNPKTEAYMAVAGPLTSILLAGILLSVNSIFEAGLPDTFEAVIRYSGYVNLGLALFNLIPAYPMDGGRVLRALLWNRNENLVKSTRIATTVSNIISLLFMGFGFFSIFSTGTLDGLWLVFIGLFINGSSKMGLSQTIISDALGEMRVRDIMTRDLKTVEPDITVQEVIDKWFSVFKHQGYPVTENGELVGIITLEDVRDVESDKRSSVTVKDIMKKRDELVVTHPDEKASDALMKIATRDVGRLPVMENGSLVGILTRSDISKTIQIKKEFQS